MHYSIVTYIQNKIHEIWSIAYLNCGNIDPTDSLQTISDANRPKVDKQLADFVCNFRFLLGSAGNKQIITDQFFFRFADWNLTNGLKSTDRLLTTADHRLTLCQLFSKWVAQTWLTVSQSSGNSRASDGR